MECPKHPGRPMGLVCGSPVCGSCYGEMLLVERMPKGGYRFTGSPMDLSKGMFGRDEHYVPRV